MESRTSNPSAVTTTCSSPNSAFTAAETWWMLAVASEREMNVFPSLRNSGRPEEKQVIPACTTFRLHPPPLLPLLPWLVSTEGKLGSDDSIELALLLLLLLLPVVADRVTAVLLGGAVDHTESPSTVISVYISTPSACKLKVPSSDGK